MDEIRETEQRIQSFGRKINFVVICALVPWLLLMMATICNQLVSFGIPFHEPLYLLSLCSCPLSGFISVIVGHLVHKNMKKETFTQEMRPSLFIGLIIGYLNLLITTLIIILIISFIMTPFRLF